MSKDFEDHPKESANKVAVRKWRNNDLTKRLKEERAKAIAPSNEPKEPEIGDVIENDKKLNGKLIRMQTKFAHEIKEMLEGHTRRNLLMYKLSLRQQIHRLKAAKLRKLEERAAQQNQGG
jgi:hypothetical protein